MTRSNGTRQSTGEDKAQNAKNSAKSLARTGAQTGGGQGEVQGRLVAIYLSAKTVTFPLLVRVGSRTGTALLAIGSALLA